MRGSLDDWAFVLWIAFMVLCLLVMGFFMFLLVVAGILSLLVA